MSKDFPNHPSKGGRNPLPTSEDLANRPPPPHGSGAKCLRERILDAIEAKDFTPPDGCDVNSFWVGHAAAGFAVLAALKEPDTNSPTR